MELYKRDACPVCADASGEVVYEVKYSDPELKCYIVQYYNLQQRGLLDQYDLLTGDAVYELVQCACCKLIYQSWCPNERFQKNIYSDWIGPLPQKSDNTSRVSIDGAKHYISEALKLTELSMASLPESRPEQLRALDFGMGKGGFASALKACGWQTYGYDLSDERMNLGERQGITVIDLEEIGNRKFEFINTEQVFEHLPNPAEIAEILVNSLVPNGLLKISVPFSRWIERGDLSIDWSAGRYDKSSPIPNAPLEHLQYFHRPSLEVLGKSLGMKRVKLSAKTQFQFSMEWLNPRMAIKNLGRIFFLDRFRNYYIFRKSDN